MIDFTADKFLSRDFFAFFKEALPLEAAEISALSRNLRSYAAADDGWFRRLVLLRRKRIFGFTRIYPNL
jgi:hypothetical protein